jgi:hypothetical protein
MGQIPLTLSRDLRKLGLLSRIAPSSNGKTADSGSAYRGSNPCGAAWGDSSLSNISRVRLALSSNGLGRSPLKAEIRVRFPLRLPRQKERRTPSLFCQCTRSSIG